MSFQPPTDYGLRMDRTHQLSRQSFPRFEDIPVSMPATEKLSITIDLNATLHGKYMLTF
jgi:hypothetical protein